MRASPRPPAMSWSRYAPEAGFSYGFPSARDPKIGKAWLAHCYGMLGVGRGNTADSSSGDEDVAIEGRHRVKHPAHARGTNAQVVVTLGDH